MPIAAIVDGFMQPLLFEHAHLDEDFATPSLTQVEASLFPKTPLPARAASRKKT